MVNNKLRFLNELTIFIIGSWIGFIIISEVFNKFFDIFEEDIKYHLLIKIKKMFFLKPLFTILFGAFFWTIITCMRLFIDKRQSNKSLDNAD